MMATKLACLHMPLLTFRLVHISVDDSLSLATSYLVNADTEFSYKRFWEKHTSTTFGSCCKHVQAYSYCREFPPINANGAETDACFLCRESPLALIGANSPATDSGCLGGEVDSLSCNNKSQMLGKYAFPSIF